MGEILWRFIGNFDRYGLYLSLAFGKLICNCEDLL